MRSIRHTLLWAALAACLFLAAVQAANLYRIRTVNQAIADWTAAGTGQSAETPDTEPDRYAAVELQLAYANYLYGKRRYDQTLAVLSRIVDLGAEVGNGNRLQARIRYNLGNLYLSQALAEIETGRLNQAVPLLTLAKQAYRQALTADDGFWDAKFNLETAMRLLPELDRISPATDDDAARPSELWTSLPGFPRGLP
ncbi:MxaK protein [Methylomonas rhizoryzae]|uniref:MxaK protein n=1 Tax=Methylomonas rhizoryzae TaxID=2608981 RepID=UPI0012323753|nr:MxaK protein [Methylomonas rhizoryzae]